MAGLRIKISAVLVSLLAVACFSLALLVTQQERKTIELEVQKRGTALTVQLAAAAANPLLSIGEGDRAGDLAVERLVDELRQLEGVDRASILSKEGRVIASTARSGRSLQEEAESKTAGARSDRPLVERRGALLEFAAPVSVGGVRIGEAQIAFDLRVLVDPVVRSARHQLTAVATSVFVIAGAVGLVLIALLIHPSKPSQ